MKISMEIIADKLSEYVSETNITGRKMEISGAVNKCIDYAYAYLLNRFVEDKGTSAGFLHPAKKPEKI